MYSGSGSFPAEEMKYLKLLSNQYKNINSAATEIINLKAILNLPKGTEHFVSDIHGEADSFSHVLRNASGVIKNQISAIFGESLRSSEKKSLATLIYYPEQKLEKMTETEEEMAEWYKITLHRLVKICKVVSSKYTRSKVRKALPKEFAYIIEELLHENSASVDKDMYYTEIIHTIIDLGQADRFIVAMCSGLRLTSCMLSGIFMTEVPMRQELWIFFLIIILWTSSGATTISHGWARRQAVRL